MLHLSQNKREKLFASLSPSLARGSLSGQFIATKVSELEINSSVILYFVSGKEQMRIHISGGVVRNPGEYIGSKWQ